MSRRNTYLLGGLAVVAGIAMLVFAIVALTRTTTTRLRQRTRRAGAPDRADTLPAPVDRRRAKREAKSRRHQRSRSGDPPGPRAPPARAGPDFSAEIIQQGSIPQALRGPFDRAPPRRKLDMSKLRGTPVVLHVWSSRCAPCRADTRLVEATWKRWGPRGVLFIGVSVKESAGAAEAVLRQYDAHLSGGLGPERRDRRAVRRRRAAPDVLHLGRRGHRGRGRGQPFRAPAGAGRRRGEVRDAVREPSREPAGCRSGRPRELLDRFLQRRDLAGPRQPPERVRLEPADLVARNPEPLDDLLDRARLALVGEAVTQLQHRPLLVGQLRRAPCARPPP